MNCWFEVKKLQGRTIKTIARGSEIDILEVGQDRVVVRSHGSSSVDRPIPRTAIESYWSELTTRGELARTKIRDTYKGRASSAIAAILAALPGVRHAERPVRLLYKTSERDS